MMVLLPVLVVLVLLVALSRRRETGPGSLSRPRASRPRDDRSVPDAVLAALHRAVGAGFITAEQEEAILSFERAAAGTAAGRAPARVPPVLEALGYLGSIFVIIGSVSLVSSFWDDLESWSRLTILGLTAAALTAAGLAVRDEGEPVLWRLRGFVLLLATGALAGFSGLLTVDSLDLRGGSVALIVGTAAAAHAGVLWSLKDRPAQHVACLGA